MPDLYVSTIAFDNEGETWNNTRESLTFYVNKFWKFGK